MAGGARIADRRRFAGVAPDILFLVVASLAGLLLIALIPPLAGGNEQMNFQRAASIANGQPLVKPVPLPGGLIDLTSKADARFREGAKPPYGYSRNDWQGMADIPLQAAQPRISHPNPIAVLNPVSYVPQAAAIAAGQAFGLSPLVIFYLGRVGGLIGGIALTFFAIRIMPVHKLGLSAIALMPPVLFSRSTLDADQLTNGLAFLFTAMAAREIGGNGRLSGARIAALAFVAFVLALSKSAYLLIPLLSLAIPVIRFGSGRRKALACALICLPGIGGSLAWMLLLKLTYFTAVKYRTWSGVVDPQQQLALVLSHPFAFAGTVLRTLFATMFVPLAVIQFIGTFGPPVTMPLLLIVAVAGLLAATILSDAPIAPRPLRSGQTRLLAAAIVLLTLGLILTLLYLQWTRLGGPVIDGFNGRYLYPLAPLLLLMIPATGKPQFRLPSSLWLLGLTIVSVGGTCWTTVQTYYG